MISLQYRLFNILLKLVNKKTHLKNQFKKNNFELFSLPTPPSKVRLSCNVQEYRIQNHNVFVLKPKKVTENAQKHILYLHGGAYVKSFTWPHWEFLTYLVKSGNCTITAPDYPLAPKNTYKQTFVMVTEIYLELVKNIDPANVILMGDSSGGGLALALAQLIKNKNWPQPAQIILLSPWLDLKLDNPEIINIDRSDPFLGIEGLKMAGKAYAGEKALDHYLVSPIYGPLHGLGKISIFIGSNEILVADARKLKALAEAKDIEVNYREYPGMFHAWMLLNLPESRKTRKEIVDLILGNGNYDSKSLSNMKNY